MPVATWSLMLAAGFGWLAFPAVGHACSKVGFVPLRSANTAHFIGTPLPDTMFAGSGKVRFAVAPGHFGPSGKRAIFGQLISVERLGGLASQRIRQPVERVVLVPWDYGADCIPTPWMRSAAWTEAGKRGLFTAVLRDTSDWAGGIPTFDVFTPEEQPYPHQAGRDLRRYRIDPDSIVPIDELFALFDLFPDQSLIPDSAESATQPLFAWARANPTLSGRYPIAQVLSSARRAVATQRLHAIESPLSGTYRLTASLSGGAPRTFYARTHRVPVSEWNQRGRPQYPVDDPTFVPRPSGYHLLATVAQSVSELPVSCKEGRDSRREAYIVVADSTLEANQAHRSWSGSIEAKLVERVFPADTALARFSRDDFVAYSRRSRERLPIETPAEFARSANGGISVEQVLTLEDGRSLAIKGMRISTDVVSCH